MAKVRQFTWKIPNQRTKRKAWGFVTVGENGKQVRIARSEWSREDAVNALAQFKLKLTPKTTACAMTLQQAIERYATAKARKKSIEHDVKYHLPTFVTAFGGDIVLSEITSAKIAEWRDTRLAATNPRTGEPYAAATINRPLAALRHLLQLALDEWGVLATVPKVRLEDEPEGRIRWLEPDEEARLLAACSKSRNPELLSVVTIALETGMRRGELLGLAWDRIDLSRGVIRLVGKDTKSGKGREIPMRQSVYNLLAGLSGPREGRVFRTRSIRTAFENAVAEAKIDNLHFHDLRHHFASWFVMRGGTLPALQKLLGHADLKMTLRYAHLSPDHLRDEIAKTERPAQAAAKITDEITDGVQFAQVLRGGIA